MLDQHRKRNVANALLLPFTIELAHPPRADEAAQLAIATARLGVGQKGQALRCLNPSADDGAQFGLLRLCMKPHHASKRVGVRYPDGIITRLARGLHQINRVRGAAQKTEAGHQTKLDKAGLGRRLYRIRIKRNRAFRGGERSLGHITSLARLGLRRMGRDIGSLQGPSATLQAAL